ncbi:hypothetical protein [Anaerosalibacter sp. Marseille-P3206]|uniref:hypothetical protein n=1 Tax=Anaerosalibacter sp. Marseille-P3206 TaxID=1871005 RepID=UPI000984297F|nr:hypothetical protein [Anaerosalibacter sp. Marseille-P3206]
MGLNVYQTELVHGIEEMALERGMSIRQATKGALELEELTYKNKIEKVQTDLAAAEQKLDYAYTADDIEKTVLDIYGAEMELGILHEKLEQIGSDRKC